MKKILVTMSLICFVAFASSAQTSPATSKEVKKETVKTEAATEVTPASSLKKSCCRKSASMADCKNKSAKNCTKASSDSKAEKTTTKEGSAN